MVVQLLITTKHILKCSLINTEMPKATVELYYKFAYLNEFPLLTKSYYFLLKLVSHAMKGTQIIIEKGKNLKPSPMSPDILLLIAFCVMVPKVVAPERRSCVL